MEKGIREKEIPSESLGRIPVPPPPGAGLPPNQQTSDPPNHEQLINDIRVKLLSKIGLTETFTVDEIDYTLRIIDRKDVFVINNQITRELNLKDYPWYNPKKSVFEQLDQVDSTAIFQVAGYILRKALVKVNGIDIQEIFVGGNSRYKTFEEGMDAFLNASSTPLLEIFNNYLNLQKRDIATEVDLKKS